MKGSIRKRPLYRVFIWVTLGACIFGLYYLISSYSSVFLPAGDTVNYWAAGKLLLSGDNPYSGEDILELQAKIGKEQEFPGSPILMVLYPPWILPLTLPLGLFSFPVTRLIWLLFNIILFLISVNYIWELYGGSRNRRIIPYLVALIFAPTLFLLGYGQISSILLLGIVFFIYFLQNEHDSRLNLFLAGSAASLATIKPHVLYLFFLALLFWIIRNRSWLVLIGSASTIFILTLISILFDPGVIGHYFEAINSYRLGMWATPTIGLYLRGIFGLEKDWLQLLPAVFGLSWFIFHWKKHYKHWDWLEEIPLLLLICIVTSPYSWTYDMVILLFPVLAVFAAVKRRENNLTNYVIIGSFLILNFVNILSHKNFSEHWFVWYAPSLLIWYLLSIHFINQGSQKTVFVE